MATSTTNEADDILASVKTLVGQYDAKGKEIIAAEARAPAAFDNMVDKPEAESAALLAGSILLSAAGGGGQAFLAHAQADQAWADLSGGNRGLRVQHSTMANQCLSATQVRSFHGYLPGAALEGASFSVYGFEATAKFEQAPDRTAVTRVHLSAPAVWAATHICSVEEFAQLTGQKWLPIQVARSQVDDAAALVLLRNAEAQGVRVPAGRLAELLRDVTQAAGQNVLPGAGGETTAGALCAFAVAILGVTPTVEFGVAVGRAEMTASGARIADHGESSLGRLAPAMHAAIEQLASRLGSHWDLVTLAAVRALGKMPAAARQTPALVAGSVFRRQLLDPQWWTQPAHVPTPAVPTQSVLGHSAIPMGLPPPAAAPTAASGTPPDTHGLSPSSAAALIALTARRDAARLKRNL